MQAELDAQDHAEYNTFSKKIKNSDHMQRTPPCKHDMQMLHRHAATVPCREQQLASGELHGQLHVHKLTIENSVP